MGLLLFVLAECSRQLMLKRYTVIAISIPLLFACLYMGSRGTRGMVRFAESVFWFAVAAGAVVILSSVSNLDLSVLKTVTEIGDEGGANLTISRVMARGGLLFLDSRLWRRWCWCIYTSFGGEEECCVQP